MIKKTVTLKSTLPLLMHNIALSDPMNNYTRAIKAISSKRKKTDEDHEAMAKQEFFGGLYWDDKAGPYLPGENLFSCIQESAKLQKMGKAVERGLQVISLINKLEYKGPRDMEDLYNKPAFRDRRAVRVTNSRIIRTRPRFPEWSVKFDLMYSQELINDDQVAQILEEAGLYIGIGDFRRSFGRFTVESIAA